MEFVESRDIDAYLLFVDKCIADCPAYVFLYDDARCYHFDHEQSGRFDSIDHYWLPLYPETP